MEALQYLGIIQVFSFLDLALLHLFAQVIIGAMDDEKNFLDEGEEYLHFLRITSSLDFIIENF